jgi:hypothetical protein
MLVNSYGYINFGEFTLEDSTSFSMQFNNVTAGSYNIFIES